MNTRVSVGGAMHPRAQELIQQLGLAPHPEGGLFRRVYGSDTLVQPSDGRGPRRSLSAIYFLLVEGAFSRWHCLRSDEAWHHYEGASVDLLFAPPAGGEVRKHTLGPMGLSSAPLHVIPAGWWQAARPLGSYALIGCSVGPGFEYDDFVLLSDFAEHARPAFDPPERLQAFL